ncbi:MAG: hypothetical protein M3Q82_04235 [Actinomycetota bacterium]|nr:hypothetical protein [Actinomycetota bacterium]
MSYAEDDQDRPVARGAVLTTPRTCLTLVTPVDYEFPYQLAVDAGDAWPWQCLPPSGESFAQSLWAGVAQQHVIRDRQGVAALELCSLYNASGVYRFGHLRVFLDRRCHRLGWPLEGVFAFVEHVFMRLELRKFYVETAASGFAAYESLGKLAFAIEGRLRSDYHIDARHEGCDVAAVSRERWRELHAVVSAIERTSP